MRFKAMTALAAAAAVAVLAGCSGSPSPTATSATATTPAATQDAASETTPASTNEATPSESAAPTADGAATATNDASAAAELADALQATADSKTEGLTTRVGQVITSVGQTVPTCMDVYLKSDASGATTAMRMRTATSTTTAASTATPETACGDLESGTVELEMIIVGDDIWVGTPGGLYQAGVLSDLVKDTLAATYTSGGATSIPSTLTVQKTTGGYHVEARDADGLAALSAIAGAGLLSSAANVTSIDGVRASVDYTVADGAVTANAMDLTLATQGIEVYSSALTRYTVGVQDIEAPTDVVPGEPIQVDTMADFSALVSTVAAG